MNYNFLNKYNSKKLLIQQNIQLKLKKKFLYSVFCENVKNTYNKMI